MLLAADGPSSQHFCQVFRPQVGIALEHLKGLKLTVSFARWEETWVIEKL